MHIPKYIHVLWNGTGQHSIVASTTVVSRKIKIGQDAGAKWQGKTYSAKIVAVGTCLLIVIITSTEITGDDKSLLMTSMKEAATITKEKRAANNNDQLEAPKRKRIGNKLLIRLKERLYMINY